MKIRFMSIGSRGDSEPLMAIGEIMDTKGHTVEYAFPAQLLPLVPKKFPKHSFTSDFLDLLESEDGKLVIGGKAGLKKFKALLRLYKVGMNVNKLLVKEQFEIVEKTSPDLIIYSGKCNYPIIWSMLGGGKSVFVSPVPYMVHYFPDQAHMGFNTSLLKHFKSLSYILANFALTKTIKSALKQIPVKIKLKDREILAALKKEKLAFTISPTLLKRPSSLPDNVQILGYHERDKQIDWDLDEQLVEFLKVNSKVLLLTFGSMTSLNAHLNSKLLYEILDELQIPVIVNKAAGGLIELEKYKRNPLFHFTSQIPYDWVLPKVYAAIHHGGSGTTHSSLKYGCATLILPHIIDQFGWSQMIADLGAGPKGIAVSKLSKHQLEPLVKDLWLNTYYKNKALEIAQSMKKEKLENELYDFIIN